MSGADGAKAADGSTAASGRGDAPDPARVAALFEAALAVPEERRDAWLAAECADAAVRAEVRSLLAHDRPSGAEAFLDSPVIRPASASARATDGGDAERPDAESDRPASIGGYRIVGVLGRGGMGTVYEAVQERPSRTVALKVIRPDLASPSQLRRFEHEAELLARLEHPGIAHVYEAGIEPEDRRTPGDGPRPWFAMELVRGRRLDAWTAAERPSIETRLELLARVCDALQHAHQKGIVHRDVKPANVLVAADGRPKLVDFGVARTLEADLRPTGIDTATGRLVGTLAYMSPEQVAGDTRRIDARSDVYAMGVVGYELLTGRLPHDTAHRSLSESVRAIEQETPARPGTVVPALRGDVETILMRALEKDPERRYPAASELAADIRRALAGEPVLARPPSAIYQLRCFARRHRALAVGSSVAAVAVLVALAATTVLAVRLDAALAESERRGTVLERESSRTAAVGDFLERTLSAPDPFSAEPATTDTTLGEVLTRAEHWLDESFTDEPFAEAAARAVLGRTYKGLGRLEEAETQIRLGLAQLEDADAVDLLPSDTLRRAGLHAEHAVVLAYLERTEEAAAALARSDALAASIPAVPPADAAARLGNAGFVLRRLGRTKEAEAAIRGSIAAGEAMGSAGVRPRATSLSNLGGLLTAEGRFDEAIARYDEAAALLRALDGPDHPSVRLIEANVAVVAIRAGDFAAAAERLEDVVAYAVETLGPAHPRTLIQLNNLAYAQHEIGALEAADATYGRALAGTEATFGREHPEYRGTLRNHAFLLSDLGDDDRAAAAWTAVADAYRGTPGDQARFAGVYAAWGAEHRVAAAAAGSEARADTIDAAIAELYGAFREVLGVFGPDADRTERVHAGIRARLEDVGRRDALARFDAARAAAPPVDADG